MTELPDIPPATPDQLFADYIAADRRRQLDEAHYAQAITDPETSQRYHTDMGFRLEIDLHRQNMHLTDRAMAEEGLSPEQRNRVMQRMITGREPYRGVPIVYGQAVPMNLPHGPFSISADVGPADGLPYVNKLTVHCICGAGRTWTQAIHGGELLVWLRDHPCQQEPATGGTDA